MNGTLYEYMVDFEDYDFMDHFIETLCISEAQISKLKIPIQSEAYAPMITDFVTFCDQFATLRRVMRRTPLWSKAVDDSIEWLEGAVLDVMDDKISELLKALNV